mgnify:CR=1
MEGDVNLAPIRSSTDRDLRHQGTDELDDPIGGAGPTGGLDSSDSIRERCRPAPQLISLRAACSNPDLVDDVFGAVDPDCGVGCLVRVDADSDGHWGNAFNSY